MWNIRRGIIEGRSRNCNKTMVKMLTVFFVLSTSLVACKPSEQTLYDFNTHQVAVYNSLNSEMENLEARVDDALKDRNFSNISFVLNNTRKSLATYELQLEQYPAPIGGENFKMAVLMHLQVIKKITDLYTGLSKLPKKATSEDINEIMDKVDILYKTEETRMKAVLAAQDEFARVNKLQLK